MALALTIAGVTKRWKAGSLRVTEPTNARMTLTATVTSAAGSYRPAIDAEVLVTDGATTLFGGYITKTREAGIVGGLTPIETTFDAADYSAIAGRRFVFDGYAGVSFPAGQTTKQRVQALIPPYLTEFGVTLGPGMGDGALLGASAYDGRKLDDVLNELALGAAPGGWLWKITPAFVLEFSVPGLVSPPTTPVWEGDLTVSPDNSAYANNILVRFGTGPKDILSEVQTGDGVTRVFPLMYPILEWLGSGIVVVNDGASHTEFTIGPQSAALTQSWTYWESDGCLHQLSSEPVVSAIGTITYSYRATFPMTIRLSDPTEMTAHGTWEAIVTYPDVFDLVTATALGQSALDRAIVTPRTVVGTTRTAGLHPGQGLTLVKPTRNLNNTFLVDTVEWTDPEGVIFYTVTMVEGATVTPNFRDDYKAVFAGTGSVGAASATPGSFTVVPASPSRASYPLGGSLFAGLRSAGPSLTRGLGGQVQLDAVALAGASVTAVVTCRAAQAGVGVIPKIVDVTHGNTVVGTGASVTSVTPVTVVFAVTPGAGVCFYELWLLPSAAAQDVFGFGYLETGR